MAAGDVVNTAERLQASAPENAIVVDATTHRATERVIEYAEARPVEAKGKAEPVTVWQAEQARSRLGVDVRQTTATELVGRKREQGLMLDALARATEERTPQLVTLVGVPGIGKSRLLWELFQHIRSGTDLVTWRVRKRPSLPRAPEGDGRWRPGGCGGGRLVEESPVSASPRSRSRPAG